MEKKQVAKIVVTGPEASGKTKIARGLAKYYDTFWVPEYARTYLDKLHRPYTSDDIPKIAKEQLNIQKQAKADSSQLLICDTGLLVPKIWLEFKYQKSDSWIENQFKKDPVTLYLLCKPDIPWEADPLRENPNDRDELYALYLKTLRIYEKPFIIIFGTNFEKRMLTAREAIDQIMSS